ncbi:MAG: LysR family transcriptional regulator [Ilumatobacter sp.]
MPSLRDADPRHLSALVAVHEHGTFANAADALGFTQSAVSQQIAQLERAAGVALFDRPKGPRPAELTQTGLAVLEYARRSLDRIDQMDERLRLMERGIVGRLTVGTFQSASAELLPNIVAQMRRELPDVDIKLEETDDLDELVRDVLNDETDLAFTVDIADDPRLEIEVIGRDRFVAVVPADEAPGPVATADDLNRSALIGQPDSLTGQRMIDERLVGAGIRTDFAFRFQNNAAVQSMVRSGMGWAVMPSLAIDASDPGIRVLEIEPPLAPRVIQLVRRAGRTLLPAAHQFAAIAHASSASLLDDQPASAVNISVTLPMSK